MKRKASEATSYEVRRRWDIENVKRIAATFHLTNDADILEYIEEHKDEGTTNLFRRAIRKLMESEAK